jgi:prepilin-type N-terminal cleavage/methylation domain-containing protein
MDPTAPAFPAGMDRPASRRGFTLIEVMLAVAIAASLIVAAMAFVFSMGELWGQGSDDRLFEQHARGVSRFLENAIRQAEPPPEGAAAPAQGAQPTASPSGVTMQSPFQTEVLADPMLTFELIESPGALIWGGPPLPFVVCSLRLDRDEGLFLQWKSRLEIDFGEGPPRETRLSPFVRAMSYFYYDAETGVWEQLDAPKAGESGGAPPLPSRIRLTFQRGTDTFERDLVLPSVGGGPPIY